MSPDDDEERSSIVEAQLTQYAKDLRELYRNKKQLDEKATETDRVVRLRVQEISAVNGFAQGALMRLFELEEAYEELIGRLDVLAEHVQPASERQTLKMWVAEGKAKLRKMREQS